MDYQMSLDEMRDQAGPDVKDIIFQTIPGTTITICALILQNNFSVVGKSACVNPDMFDKDIGEYWAFNDAMHNVGQFIGFRMCDVRFGTDGQYV